MSKDKVEATLEDRGKQYGDVQDQARLFDRLLAVMQFDQAAWEELTPTERQSLVQIQLKISRIITGAPKQVDSWHDISGYARLPGRAWGDDA